MRRIEKRGAVNVLCDDDGNGCMPATRAEIEFFDEIERLRAEVEALRADALKQVDCRQCKHATNRGCHSTALCERGELFEATPPWQFYDAARAAQGERG